MLKILLHNSLILVACIMASVLISGKVHVGVDIQHHFNLPQQLASRHVVETENHLFSSTTNIYLATEIKGQESVLEIIKVLKAATSRDTIIFHIIGYGGNSETTYYLINNIRASKAKIIMIVEGPAYSSHAYLAASGPELRMMPNSYLMFHTVSTYGTDCSKAEGIDRTVSNVEHCQIAIDNINILANKLVSETLILTPEERERILTGHDIYLYPDDVAKRIKK